MNTKELIESIYSAMENLQQQGKKEVELEALKNYLAHIISKLGESGGQLPEADLERYRAELAMWVQGQDIKAQHSIAMFQSVTASGQSALKASFLINGGSAAALLAFIGTMWGQSQCLAKGLAASLLYFMYGVLISAFASGTTYLSQASYAGTSQRCQTMGNVINAISIFCVLSTYACFYLGIHTAYSVLVNT